MQFTVGMFMNTFLLRTLHPDKKLRVINHLLLLQKAVTEGPSLQADIFSFFLSLPYLGLIHLQPLSSTNQSLMQSRIQLKFYFNLRTSMVMTAG